MTRHSMLVHIRLLAEEMRLEIGNPCPANKNIVYMYVWVMYTYIRNYYCGHSVDVLYVYIMFHVKSMTSASG